MSKSVYKYKDIREKIIAGIDIITNPVIQTMSPKGSNVMFEDAMGIPHYTNDGVTIAKQISVEEPVENFIIQTIKGGSLMTNQEAGDGTSTTILLSSVLSKGGLRLVDNGWNRMELKKEIETFRDSIITNIEKKKLKIKTDNDLLYIANISSNNDKKIAKNVVDIVKTAGTTGMVFFDRSQTADTEIIKDTGFLFRSGIANPEYANVPGRFQALYKEVPVLITDISIYHEAEAEKILNICLKNGYKNVVIIAKDFIGKVPGYFIHNHKKGNINVLPVKDPEAEKNKGAAIDDLAVYLGGKVVKDFSNITIEDFVIAKTVYADVEKTIIGRDKDEPNKPLERRISAIKRELKFKKTDELEKRLASLTNGIVTIKIGGQTDLEKNEIGFRYEDAVNATRSAMKDGYLVGGGLSLYKSFDKELFKKYKNKPELLSLFRAFTEASIRQIATNCGMFPDNVLETINTFEKTNCGYNALSGQYEDLLEVGVVDPYKVTEMSIKNAVSIANAIISSDYFIINNVEKKDDKSNK